MTARSAATAATPTATTANSPTPAVADGSTAARIIQVAAAATGTPITADRAAWGAVAAVPMASGMPEFSTIRASMAELPAVTAPVTAALGRETGAAAAAAVPDLAAASLSRRAVR